MSARKTLTLKVLGLELMVGRKLTSKLEPRLQLMELKSPLQLVELESPLQLVEGKLDNSDMMNFQTESFD